MFVHLLASALAFAAPTGFTLDLTPQSAAVVGRPLIIRATGTVPPQDIGFPYFFSLDAIRPEVATTCPPDHFEGQQFAGNGGDVLVLTQAVTPDPAGRFTIPVAVTPRSPGRALLCGYTDDGAAATLAGASLMLDLHPAPRCRRRRARCRLRPRARAGGSGAPRRAAPGRSRAAPRPRTG
jgi:hypothetical protein